VTVFAIPSSVSFLDTLATHILKNHHTSHNLLALRRVQLLLPTRRSWRKFQEALKRQAHFPFLFPQGQAITSSQEETVENLSRTLKFFAFLQDFFQKRAIPFSPQSLLSNLPALLALLEESVLYEDPKMKAPPIISDREGLFCSLREAFLEEASCRALFGSIQTLENVQRLIQQILSSSSKNPVVLAGVTALFPQMRTLFQLIARRPQNSIVLPGLIPLSARQQAVLEPVHPQYALYQILQTISCPLEEVVFLGEAPPREKRNVYPIALALLPLEAGPSTPLLPEGTLIETQHPQEEARLIAVLLREVLETPGKTAALVTMDTELAHSVVQHLRRWHLTADISQGPPWAQTLEGSLALLCAEALEEAFSPLSLLALLKHPLSAVPREAVWVLERELRAGTSPTLLEKPAYLKELFACLPPEGADTARYVQCHERLFRTVLTPEFQGEVPFFSFLRTLTHLSLSRTGYRRFFSQLLQISRCYRPEASSTSVRLFIWGPLEARLLSVDRLILGGLNEDVWTQAPNPWLSPQERQHLGLPFREQRQGLLAQDFVAAFGSLEVFLTRTCWKEGTPTSPVPWLRQWEGAFGSLTPWRAKAKSYSIFTEGLCGREKVSCPTHPCPCPPISMRPKELPVTQIAVLLRNPYAIYARYILGLKPMDSISEEKVPLLRGQYLHTVLDDMVHHLPKKEEIADFVTQLLQTRFPVPEALLYWRPRLETVLTYCLKRFLTNRTEGIRSYTEIRGSLTFPDLSFTLTGVADRIDLLPTGAIRIIDYKTGTLPSAEERRLGLAPQLPLEAAIAQFGAFPPLGPTSVDSLSFWHLRGDASTQIEVSLEDPASLAQEAYTGVHRLIAAYQDPARGYPASPLENLAPVYDAYRHLARVKEGR
jgi:ATP-dependent helicase/nuclease subunit B